MKLRSVLAGILLASGVSVAAADTVVINPQQETVIREYVDNEATASIDLPGVELKVGVDLPDTVEVHTIDKPDVKYRYARVSGRTYVVAPDSRRIIHVID